MPTLYQWDIERIRVFYLLTADVYGDNRLSNQHTLVEPTTQLRNSILESNSRMLRDYLYISIGRLIEPKKQEALQHLPTPPRPSNQIIQCPGTKFIATPCFRLPFAQLVLHLQIRNRQLNSFHHPRRYRHQLHLRPLC